MRSGPPSSLRPIRRVPESSNGDRGAPDLFPGSRLFLIRTNVFNTNTRGVFLTLREAARRVNDGGRIVAVSTGGTKMQFADASLYLGSKRGY